MAVAVDSLSRRFEALRPHLNERQRRLWLGAEARELGSGGAGVVAAAVGVAADTVRRGRAELDDPAPAPVGSSRKAGGGRKRVSSRVLSGSWAGPVGPVADEEGRVEDLEQEGGDGQVKILRGETAVTESVAAASACGK